MSAAVGRKPSAVALSLEQEGELIKAYAVAEFMAVAFKAVIDSASTGDDSTHMDPTAGWGAYHVLSDLSDRLKALTERPA